MKRHCDKLQSSPTRHPAQRARVGGGLWRAFTFVEMMVTVGIVSIVLTISAFAVHEIRDTSILDNAKNVVLTVAATARSYAIANQIETMLVVNPYNGRFEIWHLNPPVNGGPWDPLSGGTAPPQTDGYAFAPILDASATLPLNGNGKPTVLIHPIDYYDLDSSSAPYRPLAADGAERNIDNLEWAAFCFDKDGKQIIRTRRIATRSYRYRIGTVRGTSSNRLPNESPNLDLLDPTSTTFTGSLVTMDDTPITSCRGFVLSRAEKMEAIVGFAPAPTDVVNNWLLQTRPGGRYTHFSKTVLLDRFSGRELVGDWSP